MQFIKYSFIMWRNRERNISSQVHLHTNALQLTNSVLIFVLIEMAIYFFDALHLCIVYQLFFCF